MIKSRPRRAGNRQNLALALGLSALISLYVFLCFKAFYHREIFVANFYAEIACVLLVFCVEVLLCVHKKRLLFLEGDGVRARIKAAFLCLFMPIFAVPAVLGAKSVLIEYFGEPLTPRIVQIAQKEVYDRTFSRDYFYLNLKPSFPKKRLRVSREFFNKTREGDILKITPKGLNLGFYIDEREIEVIR